MMAPNRRYELSTEFRTPSFGGGNGIQAPGGGLNHPPHESLLRQTRNRFETCLAAAAVPAEKMALDVFQAHTTLRERVAFKDIVRLQPRLTPAGFTFHNEEPASISVVP